MHIYPSATSPKFGGSILIRNENGGYFKRPEIRATTLARLQKEGVNPIEDIWGGGGPGIHFLSKQDLILYNALETARLTVLHYIINSKSETALKMKNHIKSIMDDILSFQKQLKSTPVVIGVTPHQTQLTDNQYQKVKAELEN